MRLDMTISELACPMLTDEELAVVDHDAVEAGVNLWATQTPD